MRSQVFVEAVHALNLSNLGIDDIATAYFRTHFGARDCIGVRTFFGGLEPSPAVSAILRDALTSFLESVPLWLGARFRESVCLIGIAANGMCFNGALSQT